MLVWECCDGDNPLTGFALRAGVRVFCRWGPGGWICRCHISQDDFLSSFQLFMRNNVEVVVVVRKALKTPL